jgi:hypothetical protein
VPAPPTTVNYAVTFAPPLSVPETVAAYAAWEAFATTAPNELAMATVFVPVEGQLDVVIMSLSGNYYGTEDEFRRVIAPLVAVLPKPSVTSIAFGWIEGLVHLAGNNGTLDTSQPDIQVRWLRFLLHLDHMG